MLGNINVYSPKNFQVFQRTCREKGFIEFSGETKNVSLLKAKILGMDFENNLIDIETEINRDSNGAFCEKVEIPSGGWYKVELYYFSNKGKSVYYADHVGVGEVIIGAGQSNSTNCGQYRTYSESRMVSSTDGVFWQIADDPQIGVHDKTEWGSFYPTLGDLLYKEFNVPIGFASTGWGATTSEQWLPNAEIKEDKNVNPKLNLFYYLLKRVLWFGKNGFRCILWHQGEGDSGSDRDKYYANMCNIIESSRIFSGWYIPWFIAKATFCPPNTFLNEVRQAQNDLAKDGIAFAGPDTDELLGDYRDFDGEGIHFSLKGLKKHGEMWAEILIPYIHSLID